MKGWMKRSKMCGDGLMVFGVGWTPLQTAFQRICGSKFWLPKMKIYGKTIKKEEWMQKKIILERSMRRKWRIREREKRCEMEDQRRLCAATSDTVWRRERKPVECSKVIASNETRERVREGWLRRVCILLQSLPPLCTRRSDGPGEWWKIMGTEQGSARQCLSRRHQTSVRSGKEVEVDNEHFEEPYKKGTPAPNDKHET